VSLYKRCGCPDARCNHVWWYRFRLNGRTYRATSQTTRKRQALDIEARERSRLLEGSHGIRRPQDVSFRAFGAVYMKDHADLHKRSADRDREILKVLNRFFGAQMLHEITPHAIEQFKRERLAGRWRGHNQDSAPKPIQPATVNRELDTLKSILTKAVEWGKLFESPARRVKRLKVENRRTRILTEEEQHRLLAACPRKLRAVVTLALITGARIGELLALRWDQCQEGFLIFLETKSGKTRRIPISPAIAAVLADQPRVHPWLFTNVRTRRPFRSVRQVFGRAVERAGILTGDVTLHTLRHTALSRMIASHFDDYTVMEISGHSSTRMLGRYTHPTEARKIGALVLPRMSTKRAHEPAEDAATPEEIANLLRDFGGRREARTRDLRVANAALSQLS
jgi:integrase